MGSTQMSQVLQQISQWQQELLDLSNRNRLLNFRPSTTRPSSIQLIAPEIESIYEELSQGKSLIIKGSPSHENEAEDRDDEDGPEESDFSESPIPTDLPPGFAQSNLPLERLKKVALRLLRQARASEQEQGINILFAAFGLLKWRENSSEASRRLGQDRRAPLLLLPLEIEENVRDGRFRVTGSGDDPEFNHTLAERLKRDFGLSLPSDLEEVQSLEQFFSNIRNAIGQRPGWDVLEEVHIGLFQYHKIRMFKDLTEHAALAAQHDIIKALAQEGVSIGGEPDGIPDAPELDRVVTPKDSHSVLDADASQLEAIEAVKRGANLLIQGPPGTGKSQTIANIIAECIAEGKKVLFVSEKAAAIEVVHRRLSQQGLGDFCLMLHSQKSNKRDVIYDLAAQLEPLPSMALSADEALRMGQLLAVRENLNNYVDALHLRREPMGVSVYWAHGELARLESIPFVVAPIPSVDSLTLEMLEQWESTVSRAAMYSQTLRAGSDHPWSCFAGTSLGLAQERVLQLGLTDLRAGFADIRRFGQELSGSLGLPAPLTQVDVQRVIRIADSISVDAPVYPGWFDRDSHAEILTLARDALAKASELHSQSETLFKTHDRRILDIANEETIAAYQKGSLARLFSARYREARRRMREAAVDGSQLSRDEELQQLQVATEVKRVVSWFSERSEFIREHLGLSVEAGVIPDIHQFRDRVTALDAVSRILSELPPDGPEPQFVKRICSEDVRRAYQPVLTALKGAVESTGEVLIQLNEFFNPDHLSINGASVEQVPLEQLEEVVGLRLARWNELPDLIGARIAMQQAEDEGLRNLIDSLLAEGIEGEKWSDALRKLVLTHWVDTIYQTEPSLREFRGQDHSRRIEQFKNLDRYLIDSGPQRLRRLLASQRSHLGAAAAGEPGLLRHEAAKRRRHMPLRRLFERIPNLLPTLKPCLMMSPLSVAQFLPADRYRFDVVIFDEASQVRPHDAIGAILRGKQLVVAGDSKQLPPTSFFDRADDLATEEQDEDLRALESILDGLRAKGMPTRSLLWHYRSRHENLIAYSNHHFYEDRLITFPSPSAESAPGRGVRLEYVPNGRYLQETDRVLKTAQRVNREEAKRIAALVMEHARTRSNESLGVVALGTTQRDVVEDEIRQARLLDQSCESFFSPDEPEPFFVKALEQVQGDERDVMMISIGFGKNAEGVLSHNFGPINRDGGERRLNVLVTRARQEVVVVSSIRGSDIDLTRTQKMGPRLLKNYLDFAEHGTAALASPTLGGDAEYESPFEESVGRALERLGYTVHRQVGASKFRIDLAIIHPEQPGRYLLGIECDGRTYHQSKTARDRDRLRQEVLEGLGWTIHRIWSTDWIRNPERELESIVDRVQHLLDMESRRIPDVTDHDSKPLPILEEPGSPRFQPQSTDGDITLGTNVSTITRPLTAEPYEIAEIPVVSFGAILDAPLATVAQAIAHCVSVEGPIHKDLLVRRIVSAWGHQRAGARIAAWIDKAALTAIRQHGIVVRDQFFWPSSETEVVARGEDEYGDVRDIKLISDEELFEGVRQVLRHAFSLSEQELISQTARFFGYQRTGADITRRFRRLLEERLNEAALEFRADRYTLPSQ